MKTLNTILLALGAVVGTTGLYAQPLAVANIPFDFAVSTVTMPAGEYTLRCASEACNTMQIVNQDTRKSVMVMILDKDMPSGSDKTTGKVTFHRYGDQYCFAGVWTPTGLKGKVAPSRLERELRASSGLTQLASVNIPLTGAQ